ncbi:hypothetical protein [Actinoplanes sp. NPDC051859]|uniref:hypothetical protein n=1 Tax=Actinoplanes sp. NPDC051859 TaxID=3363909 RepID=UPI0037914236
MASHYWELTFDRSGTPTTPRFVDDLAARGITDLFVMAHGWNISEQRARTTFRTLFPLIEGMAPGTPGFVGLFWPSMWFPDPPPSADAQVRAAMAEDRPGVAATTVTGAEIAASLTPSFPATSHAALHRMGELVDAGRTGVGTDPAPAQQKRLDEFQHLLRTVFAPVQQSVEDSGELAALLTDEPRDTYARLADVLGSAPRPHEVGWGDVFGKVWNAARDVLRMASYYEMKARAGDIGSRGLGPFLADLHTRLPGLRVHLSGHSFGARLVSYALTVAPAASLCLIQAAFSHYAFTPLAAMPFGSAGALHRYADRVTGPLIATWTPHDWALRRWYPKVSFLARDDAALTKVDPALRWGALGADGFQGVTPARRLTLLPPATMYGLAAQTFHSVDSTAVIADTGLSSFSGAHADFVHPEVAWLLAAAAR